MKKYRVYEDNGGGLYLAFYDSEGNLESLHEGYEYRSEPGGIMADIEAVKNDPDDNLFWDNNLLQKDFFGGDFSGFNGFPPFGLEIVADNDGIYPERMGVAACREFSIKND